MVEDARFASASKQTKTEGFGVPHVLRDFVSARTVRRCLIFSVCARSSSRKKKYRNYTHMQNESLLFQSHRRLKRVRSLFPLCEGVELILGFLTSKWMSRSIIGKDEREIFTFYTSV